MAIRESGFGRGTIWMISFGDLLTLLTCFIVAGVSAGRQTAPSEALQPVEVTRSILVEPEQVDAGISLAASLAESYRRRLLVELPIFESHIASRFGEPNAVGFAMIRQVNRPSEPFETEIEACALSADAWRDSERITAAIDRVLIDQHNAPPGRTRWVGNRCDQITSFTPGSERVMAVVRMIRPMEPSNG